MHQSNETRTGFWGTYFDRDATLRLARLSGILAWVLLAAHIYIAAVSLGQYLMFLGSGAINLEAMTLFDRLSTPITQVTQLTPGVVYFVLFKTAQHVLLILLDVEDNARRAARN